MPSKEDPLERKAVLSLGGGVRLPEGYEVPVRISRSTAGPGAGFGSVAFEFGGFRVKKSVSYDSGEFELHVGDDGRLSLTRDGEPFLDEVRIVPVARHCPEQAFFDLDPRCSYHCAFCSSPRLEDRTGLTTDEILEKLAESVATQDVLAVSFTSGVAGSIDETVDRMVDAVSRVREEYPDMPIGVEPYVSTRRHVERLKEAGADEIKLNLQAATADLFAKVCPDLDRDLILARLADAVEVFGKGRVISNMIYGFGETDDDVAEGMELLCGMGVIPGIRALRINRYNREPLAQALGELEPVSAERAMRLARLQKEVMESHGLTSETSITMCLKCGCCDLVPFRDLRGQMGRYERQLLEFTEEEQERILYSTVGLIGCGGLGTNVSTALALAGVGHLRIMDPDVPEESNLNRQYVFCGHVGDGRSKAELLAEWIRSRNPDVDVECRTDAFGPETRGFYDGCDVLVDCLDSIGGRMSLNEYSMRTGRPLVHGGIDAFVGEVAVCVPGRTPCLRCMMGSVPEKGRPAASIGSVVSTVGAMEATEVLKLLTGRSSETEGVFLSMDFERWRMTPVRFPRNPDCPVCGRL